MKFSEILGSLVLIVLITIPTVFAAKTYTPPVMVKLYCPDGAILTAQGTCLAG